VENAMFGNPPYDTIRVPGHEDISLLVVSSSTNNHDHTPAGSRTPWWMIKIQSDGKELMSSTIEKYEKYGPLFGFLVESRRAVSSDSGNQLFTAARILHDDCFIVILNGGYVAALENKMHSGSLVGMIEMSSLAWINGELKICHRITFTNSPIKDIIYFGDYVIMRVRVTRKNHAFMPFDQKGVAKGNAICTLNMESNIAELQ
jgi:hypothetical protein